MGKCSGAISRSGLEKNDPKISYERFVEDLDVGDSFTVSVIDCLVKEVADRRSRPEGDRRIIAERTVKSLRTLIAASRVASAERGTRRAHTRRFGLSDFLSSHHDENSQDDDEEEFNAMLEPPAVSVVEGTRLSSAELFNYNGPTIPPFLRQSSPIPISSTEDDSPPSFVAGASPARIIPTSSTSRRAVPIPYWSRQPTTRRPSRLSPRQSDFSEFASRRRRDIRDSIASRLAMEEPSSSATRSRGDGGNAPRRRFFPTPSFSYRRYESGHPWSDGDSEGEFGFVTLLGEDGPFVPSEDMTNGEHTVPSLGHRLSRSGLRAPESMLSRHASPVYPTYLPPDGELDASSPPPVEETPREVTQPNRSTAYPTPGPGDPETP
ncbi:hypothetical protein VNI00_001121 [Paramarasmius palmivorus]|uniref:Uncharacterized protein n=1 Tax=Paramarasmius palmivorus TaxID=297713 RepID=A0AAW0E7Y5_9AGAR